jgi:chemotaxis signal transduction protein
VSASRTVTQRGPRPEHVDLLRARAAALARVERPEERHDLIAVVAFTLGGEHYGLDARMVREISGLSNLMPLPTSVAPRFGITHWRGSALMIFDLRAALGLDTKRLTDLARVLIVEGPSHPFGILADAVHNVVQIDRAALRAVPRRDEAGHGSLIVGAAEGHMLLIDSDALLQWAVPRERTPGR